MDPRPKCKAKIVTPLEENIGVSLHGLVQGKVVLDTPPKAKETKEKVDKLDFIRVKNC